MARPPATRSAGRPVGSDGAATRARILQAARETFAQRGYDRANPADIASAAGVGRTAVYNYFGSKAELYRAVIEDLNAAVLDPLFGAETRAIEDPVSRVEWMLRESARRNAADPSIGRFLSTMMVDALRNPEFAAVAEAEVERTRQFFTAALEQATAAPAVPELVDLLVAVQWGLGLFAAFMGDADRVQRMTEQLIEVVRGRFEADD